MQLFVQVDASAEPLHDTFSIPEGSIVEFRFSSQAAQTHGAPAQVSASIIEGGAHAEVLGSFDLASVRQAHANAMAYEAQAPIPPPGLALVSVKQPGTAVIEVKASSGPKSTITRFTLKVTEGPEPVIFEKTMPSPWAVSATASSTKR